MALEIDIGDELAINVKYAGKVFPVREPSVEEVEKYKNVSQDASGFESMIGFLINIGMPEEVVKKMGLSKANAIIEGMMDLLTKKK